MTTPHAQDGPPDPASVLEESEKFRTARGVQVEEFLGRVPTLAWRGLTYALLGILAMAVLWARLSEVALIVGGDARLVAARDGAPVGARVEGWISALLVDLGQPVTEGQVLMRVRSPAAARALAGIRVEEARLSDAEEEIQERLPERLALLARKQAKLGAQKASIDALRAAVMGRREARETLHALSIAKHEGAAEDLRLRNEEERTKVRLAALTVEHQRAELVRERDLESRGLMPAVAVGVQEYLVALSVLRHAQAEQESLRVAHEVKRHPDELRELTERYALEQLTAAEEERQLDVSLAQAVADLAEAEIAVAEARLDAEGARDDARLALARARAEMPVGIEVEGDEVLIRAPRAGAVTYLAARGPGVYTAGGAILARISPEGEPLVARMTVANDKVAFVRVGQEVRLKYAAYPFQQYGILSGEVASVAPDATEQQAAPGAPGAGSLGYEVTVRLVDTHVAVEDQGRVPLRLGLAARAEVVAERRSLLHLFLRPFEDLVSAKPAVER